LKLKNQVLIVSLLLIIMTVFISPEVEAAKDIRILVESDNYILQKYEPREGIYLGAYVYQDTLINGSMEKFNELTGKDHTSFFYYVGYGRDFPEEWVAQVKEVGAIPHIAWEPNDGLDVVKDDEYLREFARKAKEAEVPIFLRYASEMNGDWTAYSGDTEKYIEKWRLVYDVMKEEAPNVMMVWTVFTFPQGNIKKYYPGDEYVDWVGVNIYNVIYHNDNLNHPAKHEDPLELLDYVYDNYSHRKPIQISEYGATHYTITDGKEYEEFAISKISRLYNGLKTKYPRVKSIFYFNVNNLVNAPEGRKINNYAITDNENILNTYKELIEDEYFISKIHPNLEGETNKELFTIKNDIRFENGVTYISSDILREHFNTSLSWNPETREVTVRKGDDIGFISRNPIIIDGKSYFPLRDIAERLGYKVMWDSENSIVKVILDSKEEQK